MDLKIQLFLKDGLFLDAVQCVQQHPVDQHDAEQQTGPGQEEQPVSHQFLLEAACKNRNNFAHDGGQQQNDPLQSAGIDADSLPGS